MKKMLLALMLGAAPFAVSAQTQPTADARIATEVFGQIPLMTGPELSPDGTKVALQLAIDGATHLAVIDLNNPSAKPTLISSAGEYREVGDRTVVDWRWVGNDNVVVTLASRENIYGQRYDVTRLFAYDIDNGKVTPLAWDGAMGQASRILNIDHDDETILLERQSNRYGSERWFNPEVVRVDVETGKFTTAVRANPVIGSWFADSNGIVRAGTGYDRDTGEEQLIYRSNADENFDTVSRVVDKDFTGAGIVPSIFLPEPDMAIVTSNRDGVKKVYRVNLDTMQFGEPLFAVEGYDVGGAIANEDRNALIGVGVMEEGARYYWMDPVRKAVQKQLVGTFGESNAVLVSSNEADTRFIVEVGAANQAGAYYIYDIESGDMKLLGWRDGVLKDMKLNPVSTVRYRASDGETIPAVVTMPRHRDGKNLPAVILTHGGPFGVRDAEEYDSWAQAIAELGYVVIQPNYRGSGGYGNEWIKKGRNDGFGMRMQDDLNDAITYFAAQGIIDADRVCMMGWSYGGYAAARAAQRDADKYRCTIAGAGVYDLPMMKQYDATYLGSFGAGYLSKGAADLTAVSPARNTDGDWAPIMIVHGVRDDRVPVEQGRTLASRLEASGKVRGEDFAYVEQPKNTHHLPYSDVRVEWLKAAERWLAKNNPPYVPSDSDKPVPVGIALAN